MAHTQLELENVQSCNIKGSRSWPSVAWLLDGTNNLLLNDGHKSKRLDTKDGSITKHSPLVDRLISECQSVIQSPGGQYLYGIKRSGDIFLWSATNNVVYSLHGVDAFKDKDSSVKISASGDGKLVDSLLVVKHCNQSYLWVRNHEPVKIRHPPKVTEMEGRWFTLDCQLGVNLPDLTNHEAVIDIYTAGKMFLWSTAFIDDTGVLQLSTLYVTTEPSLYGQRVSPRVEWYNQKLAGSADFPITTTEDLLLVRYAPTITLCAVIINQVSVRDQCVMFVSPRHDYQVSANLKCLTESPSAARSPIWISDIQWTYNSLLLVVLTQSGSVAILSRLGNPLQVTTREMSARGGGDYLLSLLPRNVTNLRRSRGLNRSLSLSSAAERHVSLSCHPKSMRFLITDGTQIMVFQIPEDVTTRSLAMAMLSDVRIQQQARLSKAADMALSLTHSLSELESGHHETIELPDTELRTLIQIWCLLISSDRWSRELKDVSNEVIRSIAEIIHSQIDPNTIEESAVRLVRMTVTLITMVTIDSQHQHMLPASIKLISLLVKILLGEDNYSVNTRVALTKITYVLIKICENVINRTYTALPVADSNNHTDSRAHQNITHEVVSNTLSVTERIIPHEDITAIDDPTAENISLTVKQSSLAARGLAGLYMKIERHLVKLYKQQDEDTDVLSIHQLLEAVQCSLHHTSLPQLSIINSIWLQADILCLEGFSSSAIREWLDRYRGAGMTQSKMSDVLHSVLYNKLYNARLHEVLQLMEGLILETVNSQHQLSDKEYLNVRMLPPGSAVRKVIQSLARFMARYFTNSDLYVFPSHYPHVLPSLYAPTSGQNPAVLSVDRKHISDASMRLVSEDMWSVGATVRYLLISGLVSELVWFCKSIGDLKTALSISLLVSDHHKSLKHIKRHEVNTILPDDLKADAIHSVLVSGFMEGHTERAAFHFSVHYLMLPTALFGYSCINVHLSSLWQQIKKTACRFSALVPNEFYLPSPELYCTQMPSDDGEKTEELESELELRQSLSSDIHTLIDVLIGTHTDLPCCGWYVRQLSQVWKRNNQADKKSKLFLTKALEVYRPHHVTESDKHNKLVFAIFRNLCSVLWMLHVRDQLSLMLRKSTELLQNRVTVTTETDDEKGLAQRHKHLEKTLTWCLRYLPYAQYLQCTNNICEVVISICEDLPPSAKLARKLSQGITDIDSLAPEVKDKMDHLLQTWQTVDFDPKGSRSLSMYYFECCHKFERQSDQEAIEKHVFSTSLGHKNVGTRSFEFDDVYTDFLELFFSVCFYTSLPAGGTAASTALVSTNRKTLEQIHLSKQSVVFDENEDTLESTLINQNNHDVMSMTAGRMSAEYPRSDSPGKSGMFRNKRWSNSEAQTMKQMKRLGVSQTSVAQDSIHSGSRPASGFGTFMDPPVSQQLLTQNIKLPERYHKLAIKYQWLSTWCEKSLPTMSSVPQPSTKVEMKLQWLILALIMVEKSRQGARAIDHSLPPRSDERQLQSKPATISSPPKPDNMNNNALANAISLHTSTEADEDLDEEEVQDRQEIMEEMRRHSRLATATQPINLSNTKLTLDLQTLADDQTDKSERMDAGTDGSRTARSLFMEDSATTVWSSASLPNMSGSSQVTGGLQPTTVDTTTVDQQSTALTQQSVSTIGSRRDRSLRRSPDRLTAPPVADSTHLYTDERPRDEATPPYSVPTVTKINSQIPLLHLSKENQNNAYYASAVSQDSVSRQVPRQRLGYPQHQQPEILQIHDSTSRPESTRQSESVRLPLLSIKPGQTQGSNSRTSDMVDGQRLAEIRARDTRWGDSVPLLNMRQEDIIHEPVPENQTSYQPAPKPISKQSKSIALGFGPALLQEYDEANQQKEELLSRMIKAMRAKCVPSRADDGRPNHPKFHLLKLDPPPKEPTERPRRAQRGGDRVDGGYRDRNEPRKARRSRDSKSDRKKKSKSRSVSKPKQDEDLATVSEHTEQSLSPGRVEAGTDASQVVETKDQSIQHSPVHVDNKFNDYSYLFELATSKGDGESAEPIKMSDLDAAADDNTFAATQYKAMKLQQEEAKPKMVDASVMAVSSDKPRTIIVRQERPRERDAPNLAPNLIHDLQFASSNQQTADNKENQRAERRQFLGVVDIPLPPEPIEPTVEPEKPEPRSKQILQELRSNSEFIQAPEERADDSNQLKTYKPVVDRDTLHIPYYESEELSPPKLVTPRVKRFESMEVKGEGKSNILRNLCNMDDRLDYIDQLTRDMVHQIEDTELVLPRYHISYQQRQTQTRLSIPGADQFATILHPDPELSEEQTTSNQRPADSHLQDIPVQTASHSSPGTPLQPQQTDRSERARQLLARLDSGAVSSRISTARVTSTPRSAHGYTARSNTARSNMAPSGGRMSRRAESVRSVSAMSDGGYSILGDTTDMIRQADNIVGDESFRSADINDTMIADLLGSDMSLISQRGSSQAKAEAYRKAEELKKWKKEHQAKVKGKYRAELDRKRKPEANPFNVDKAVTGRHIKKIKKAQQTKREEMIALNQNKRMENAENLLEDLIEDGAELLAMERMMDLTRPIAIKKTTPQKTVNKSQRKPGIVQRGKSTIRTDSQRQSGYTPRGYHTVESVNAAHAARVNTARGGPEESPQPFSIYSQQQLYQGGMLRSDSYDRDELPLEDESHLLVPIITQQGEVSEAERIHRLLYSDEPLSRYGSEMNLSNLSDLISESELSAGSYLDWDVVDEMVAILSNRELSTPSTLGGNS